MGSRGEAPVAAKSLWAGCQKRPHLVDLGCAPPGTGTGLNEIVEKVAASTGKTVTWR